jgi:DDE superfamily endonuclease
VRVLLSAFSCEPEKGSEREVDFRALLAAAWLRCCARRFPRPRGVADDTGFPKDGDYSVGVQRQYPGTLGKTANCQLGVSVNAVAEQASCPLDWRLFLPERWDADAERRAAYHVPERVRHRPKWQLVLDMLDELDQWGLSPPVLVADAGYGEVGEFRQGLDDRQVPYVVQVKADTSAYPERVRPTTAPYTGRGRRPRPRYRDQPRSLKQLALQAGQQAGVELVWRRGSKGLQRGRFLALRVRPAGITPRRQGAAHARGRRRGATSGLAVGRMARQRGRAGQVLAVEPARDDPDGGAGAAGQVALAGGDVSTTVHSYMRTGWVISAPVVGWWC